MLKRRKNKKTDYKQRLSLLRSRKPRLVVRRALNNIHAQIIKYERNGDITIIEVSSKNLVKYGWKGHLGNLPSAYLCGLLVGLKAMKKDVHEAILDIGLQTSVKASSVYAVALAAKHVGMKIALDEKITPDMKRISGSHISDYAKLLKSDAKKYNAHFSSYLKNGLMPEKIPEHFEETKNKILDEFGVKVTAVKPEKEKTVERKKTEAEKKVAPKKVEEAEKEVEDVTESGETEEAATEEEWEDAE